MLRHFRAFQPDQEQSTLIRLATPGRSVCAPTTVGFNRKEQVMNRVPSFWRLLACVLLVLGAVAVASSEQAAAAAAAARPFASRGTAHFVNANDFVGAGSATHLGRYQEQGTAEFTPTDDPTVFDVDAVSTYTAANGDQLHAVISGSLDGLTGRISATVTYTGGTGRFANARGTANLEAQLLPDGSVDAEVEGTIDY
jgi:hypothetical protein